MSYRFDARDSVIENIRRIACEQIDKAIAEIEDSAVGPHATVHQIRKRCKKLRGLVRLVRPVFNAYREENAWYRDAARSLSYIRDAHSIVETHDALIDHFADQLDPNSFQPIRATLLRRRDRIVEDRLALNEQLEKFLVSMREGRSRTETWKLEDDGCDAIASGLKKVYRRGRKTMRQAREETTTTALHEWRKRVKYHWYHLRLLKPLWPEVIKKRRNEVKKLADFLGDDHDLAVLADVVSDECADNESLQAYFALLRSRRMELQRDSDLLGRRIYCEPPKAFSARYHHYWGCWKEEKEQSDAVAREPVPA